MMRENSQHRLNKESVTATNDDQMELDEPLIMNPSSHLASERGAVCRGPESEQLGIPAF